MKDRLEQVGALAAGRPRATVAVVALLAITCGLLSLGLSPSTASDTFVPSSSATYRATAADQRHFGGDAVVVLVREPLTDLMETSDLGTITQLEACFAGQVVVADQQLQNLQPAPRGALAPYGGRRSPCGQLMKHRPVQVVYGPGTFLNQAVGAVSREMLALAKADTAQVQAAARSAYQNALAHHETAAQARAAATAAASQVSTALQQQIERFALDTGITSIPTIYNTQFINAVVFDQTRGVNEPKARFSYLFPTRDAALIQVRLKANLSQAQTAEAIGWIRQAVRMPMFAGRYHARYAVTGEPVVLGDLASSLTGSIVLLLAGAVVVMALMLMLVFRGTFRLLPLAIALAAAAITFGATSLAGATLTMASIAVLPILIGLAVDYAIQFQSRAREARTTSPAAAVNHAARHGAPTIATAALATATGFLVLLLSPVPMVQGFGLLLVVGIAIALACTITAGAAAIVLAGGGWGGANRLLGILGDSLRGAGEILADLVRRSPRPRLLRFSPTRRARLDLEPAVARVLRHPGRVLAVGAALALAGWIADTQTGVQSDVTKLVPSSMPALRNLKTLERVTGVSGEIDVAVQARNVATPATIGWMTAYESRLLQHFGYLETKGCATATLCPALSLPDLFASSGGSGTGTGPSKLTAVQIQTLLQAVPPYFSQAVISADHRNAVLSFGIRLMPLARQQRVIDYMRTQLHPPRGVSAELAGLPVLAAQANAALSSSGRRLLTLLAGLVAVGLVLLAILRTPRRALVPLVPIALATGWSSLVLFLIGIPLNPMSATLGALVIAISTEFSVLLSERYRQEQGDDVDLPTALRRAYRSTGRAVIASGLTAIAGFGILILSNITMLRDFGFVTVIDLTVSLAGVLLVLPAVLVVAERGDLVAQLRAAVATAPRRRATVA